MASKRKIASPGSEGMSKCRIKTIHYFTIPPAHPNEMINPITAPYNALT